MARKKSTQSTQSTQNKPDLNTSTTKKSTKKLNIAQLKSLDKQFSEQKEVIINDYKLNVDTKFRNSKIIAMFADLQEKINHCRLNGIEISDAIWALYPVLLIKYFTSLDIPNEIEQQFHINDQLIDHNFLVPIIEAFPEDQMDIINEKLQLLLDNKDAITDLIADEVLKEDFQLQNEDVMQMKDWATKIKQERKDDETDKKPIN